MVASKHVHLNAAVFKILSFNSYTLLPMYTQFTATTHNLLQCNIQSHLNFHCILEVTTLHPQEEVKVI
jgi:hypothetical protein